MAVPTFANYVFLPWARQGAASGIQTQDMSASQAGVVSVAVKLRINETNDNDIDRQVRLYGPGDVTGIDPQQVVRTEPRHLAMDFEPNYFPAIEFDRPDFPWLFTPAKADDGGKLRPWLCLVVVRKQEGVTLSRVPNLPLPVLEINAPAQPERELPDLSESWAWAHTQIMGSQREAASLKQSLAGDPALTLSRLLCPRRLDPVTEYLACVVPAFELGRKAGLGEQIKLDDEQKLEPAWISGATQVTLPVYFSWEFRTGAGGDFEALVRLLEARKMPEMVGKRLMDINQPGFSITPPLPPGTMLEFEGALRVPDAQIADWPEVARTHFQTGLKTILDAPWQAAKEGTEPLLAPPIYGCWQAARHTVNLTVPSASLTARVPDNSFKIVDRTPAPPVSATWLDELNLDPRHRAVAALGTKVVQTQQEPLMASAWAQLGEIERINQLLRQAQLGRAVNAVYHGKHFSRFSEETLLKVVALAQARVVVAETVNNLPTTMLLSQRISQSAIPARAVSAPLRRLTSSRGVISARFQPVSAPSVGLMFQAPSIGIIGTLNTNIAIIVQAQKQEAGLVTINQVSDQIPALAQTVRSELASGHALDTAPLNNTFKILGEIIKSKLGVELGQTPTAALEKTLVFTPVLQTLAPTLGEKVLEEVVLEETPMKQDSADAAAFRNAAKNHQDYLGSAFMFLMIFPMPLMNLPDLKVELLQSVNPEKAINARVQASLIITGVAGQRDELLDPLEPILDAPDFPQPMYEALRDLSQDFLFPGLEHVPPNTVTLLETNPKFVESFLVGLNAEMSSELLWRNYPTDQRGTYFRQFWDTSAGSALSDIEPVHTWRNSKLGQNAGAGEQLVLLLRGELLRRYPNSVVYAVQAVRKDGLLELSREPEDERHPLFRGTLKPDVTFLGFDLTREEVIGKEEGSADPGWFFVIQEQPTEPRFGMDAAEFDKSLPELTTWNNLNWRHLANTEATLKALAHASINIVLPDIDKAKWGRNSAHQAYITLQRPVRIAIHARDMILQEPEAAHAHS